MHFSIPDTQDLSDSNGSTYTAYNIHINGVYHCSLRYRQLHSFNEQLKKEFGGNSLPSFPPKKLLSLTQNQLEERRLLLEKYIQTLSQNPQISTSDTFNGFLLHAQQESQREEPEEVTLDIYLMNGHKISIGILSTDQTDDVLEVVSSQIELPDDYVYYFGLYLIKKEDSSENAIVRKLQEFESPYISLKAAAKSGTHRIVLRKSYWDPMYDDELLKDRIAMNLIYVQAVSDVERGWVVASKDQLKQLDALQQKGSKKEYLRLCRTLKYYGFMQFQPCVSDYPQAGSRVLVSAGNKELTFRFKDQQQTKEVVFRVTRMRCWRITTSSSEMNGESSSDSHISRPHLELAFEYLVAKDTLKWVTIISEQAILMSMCLQGMVDELMMKKQGSRIKRPQDRSKSNRKSPLSPRETGTMPPLKSPSTPTEENHGPVSSKPGITDSVKKLSDKALTALTIKGSSSTRPSQNAMAVTENEAFDGIGDDDL